MGRIEEIVASIDGRLAELHREIGVLSQARAALGDSPAARPPRSRTARKPRRPSTTGGRRRSPRKPALDGPRLEQLLAAGPSSLTALARRTGAQRDQVAAVLEQLHRASRVRRTGAARSPRWQLVSDEERIAARAAELAKQRRKRG